MKFNKKALKYSLAYFTFGILINILSDFSIGKLTVYTQDVSLLSIISALPLVTTTTILIYYLLTYHEHKLALSKQNLQDCYDDLYSIHEELLNAEEDLRHRFEEVLLHNEEVSNRNIILKTLQDTTFGLINQLDRDTVLHKIILHAAELAGTPHGFICLLDEEKKFMDVKIGLGVFKKHVGVKKIDAGIGLISQIIQTGASGLIKNYDSWEHKHPDLNEGIVHTLFQAPLKSKQEVIGSFGLALEEKNQQIEANHYELFESFAELASIALQNAKLHTELQQKLDDFIKNEASIHAIFNAVNDAVFVHDAITKEIVIVNIKATELFGYTLEEFQQLYLQETTSSIPLTNINWIDQSNSEYTELFKWTTVNKSGKYIFLEVNLRKSIIAGRNCVLAVVRDISERRRFEKQLTKAETDKLALLDAIPDLILRFNQKGYVIDCRIPSNGDTYAPSKDFLHRSITDIMPPHIAPNFLHYIEQTLTLSTTLLYEYQLTNRETNYHYEARFVKCSETESLAIIRDITDKKHMAEQLAFLSLHDTLTGIYNRTYFEEELRKIRNQQHTNLGILIGDVDGLKLINDTLGHQAGDEILKIVATILLKSAGTLDIVARIGGDEFALLIFEPAQTQLDSMKQNIKASIIEYNNKNPQLPISLSLGWALTSAEYPDIDLTFKTADNNMYREKIHQSHSTRSTILQTLIQAMETRDYMTDGHGERLQELVVRLGHKLHLPDQNIADLCLLARFHDLGKVGIPDYILFKPEILTTEETAIMQRHCEIGFRIARSSPDLFPIADWILKHHEWWNGKGYPLALSGESIPLECRILAVADAYDAMTNKRTYREVLSKEEALIEIKKCAGTQFDPELAIVFIELAHQNIE